MAEDWEKRIQQYRTIWKQEPELLAVAKQLLEESREVLPTITVYVTAPLLCAYVAWVIREAVQSGKKRLYFLARDGYYMKKVAEIFCMKWQSDMECRYLYCSRYAWRGAVYHMNIEEALDYVTLGGLEVNFYKIMQRAGLKEKEAIRIAEQLGYDINLTKRFSVEERKVLRKKLSECKDFIQLLQNRSKEKYQKTIAYLAQEGLMDAVPYALVDSGWTGSLQKSLAKILESTGYQIVLEGYYFGMYSRSKQKEAGNYHTYYFSSDKHIKRKVFFNNNVFECIYSAPHGMTIGYEKKCLDKKETWIPVLEQKDNPNRERLLAAEPFLFAYISKYADVYQKEWSKGQETEQKRLECLLRLFMSRPVKEEVLEYGNYVFCDDVIGEEKQILAENLSKKELKQGFLLEKLKKRLWKSKGIARESAWPEGSVSLAMRGKGFWHCVLCEYVRFFAETLKNKRQDRKNNE